jgi:DNA-binding LacI/PurR family transcriptional regulator
MNSKVTIETIALEAGVSKATVSRVFNGKSLEKVGPKVRKRVESLIKKYGYRPSIHATGLACGKSSLIGVQLLSMTSPLSNVEIIESLENAASNMNYNIILGISGWDEQRETRSIDVMLEKGVDGIIWQPIGNPNQELMKKIVNSGHPLVWCNKDCGNGFPGAFNNELTSGRMAFEYLTKEGCKNPVFIGFDNEQHTSLRWRGWSQAAEKSGVKPKQLLISGTRHNLLEVVYNTVIDVFKNNHQNIDGAFLAGSTLTKGGYTALHELQIAKKDFPVIGHNLLLGKENYIPIPIISPRSFDIGRSAFEILTKLLAGKTAESIFLEPVLKETDYLFNTKTGDLY